MQLPRLHLFELEDLDWFPQEIRDLATDYLRFMEARFKLHRPVVPLLRGAIEVSGVTHFVDLCSGGGGPVKALYEALLADGVAVKFTLTDKYPNLAAFHVLAAEHPGGIAYVTESVDAASVPRELSGFRTMFNAFHHFRPAAGRAVLRAYTPSELKTLAEGPGDGGYEWKAGRVPLGVTPGHLTYLVGIPRGRAV